VPSKKMVRNIKRRHVAWRGKEPSAWDLQELFRKHANTRIVTCTKRGAALVNNLASDVLFRHRHKQPLGTLPGDYDANPDNSPPKGEKRTQKLCASTLTVYKDMRIHLTRNMDKENGFVNGMTCRVKHYDEEAKALEVVTEGRKRLIVHLITEDVVDDEGKKLGRVTYFPIRLGYASTVQKVQGSTLDHVTVWLDCPGCRAAAYVALSRVRRDEDYLIGGSLHPNLFVPAM
jgi:hypothetical protein